MGEIQTTTKQTQTQKDKELKLLENNFGAILKEAREKKNLSIKQVSMAIKINISVIQNIEASNLEDLPKPIFLRRLIKVYCKYLDFSEDVILENFDKLTKFTENSPINNSSKNQAKTRTPTYVFLSKVIFPIFIVILIGASFVGIVIITKKYEGETKATVNTNVQAIHKAKNADAPNNNNSIDTLTAVKKNEKPSEDLETTFPNDEIRQIVTLEPLAKTMVFVEIDNGESQKIILRPNINRTFRAKNSIKLHILDGGAINIIHNNKDIGVPGVLNKELFISFPNNTE